MKKGLEQKFIKTRYFSTDETKYGDYKATVDVEMWLKLFEKFRLEKLDVRKEYWNYDATIEVEWHFSIGTQQLILIAENVERMIRGHISGKFTLNSKKTESEKLLLSFIKSYEKEYPTEKNTWKSKLTKENKEVVTQLFFNYLATFAVKQTTAEIKEKILIKNLVSMEHTEKEITALAEIHLEGKPFVLGFNWYRPDDFAFFETEHITGKPFRMRVISFKEKLNPILPEKLKQRIYPDDCTDGYFLQLILMNLLIEKYITTKEYKLKTSFGTNKLRV